MERKPTDFYLQLSILKTPIGHVYLYHKTVRIVSLRGEHVLYVKDWLSWENLTLLTPAQQLFHIFQFSSGFCQAGKANEDCTE